MNDFQFLHDHYDVSNTDLIEKADQFPEIFLVEDDKLFGMTLKKYLEKKLFRKVRLFSGPQEFLTALEEEYANIEDFRFVLISDIAFNDSAVDGLLLIDTLKEKNYDFVSIVMTGFASIETAITATKKGVFHYLTKPFDLEILEKLIVEAVKKKFGLDMSRLLFSNRVNSSPKVITTKFKIEAPKEEDIFCGMIGRSQKMRDVFDRIRKVASSDSTILVTGPSGTGKELVSNAIHKLSNRFNEKKISVNCGAIPSELLESELFGHEKGAFTGAISTRKGRFELANNGTIFLDEIGDMPLILQVKLLRVLQNREIERVGASESIPVNVRIITATHRNLEKAVESGDFREDLYYRLNVIPVRIPALSERRDDIPLLISYFLSRFVSADGRNAIDFSDEALEILMTYDWPGNVRELENLIERLVILKGGSQVTAEDLPAKFLAHRPTSVNYNSLVTLPDNGLDLKRVLVDIEESLITQALEKTGGNKNQASKLLKMNRTTLIEKMKKRSIAQISTPL